MQCKIPACRSTERCPGGILSLHWQSQIPTEIAGLLTSLCGEPFSRERWLLSFCKHVRLAARQRDKHEKYREKGRQLLMDRCLQPTHKKRWALSTHALIDRLAYKMEMKAGGKLTYAYNTHGAPSMHLCKTRALLHSSLPHSAVCLHSCLIFLRGQEWRGAHTDFYTSCHWLQPLQAASHSRWPVLHWQIDLKLISGAVVTSAAARQHKWDFCVVDFSLFRLTVRHCGHILN